MYPILKLLVTRLLYNALDHKLEPNIGWAIDLGNKGASSNIVARVQIVLVYWIICLADDVHYCKWEGRIVVTCAFCATPRLHYRETDNRCVC
jgi:hypothetical protein